MGFKVRKRRGFTCVVLSVGIYLQVVSGLNMIGISLVAPVCFFFSVFWCFGVSGTFSGERTGMSIDVTGMGGSTVVIDDTANRCYEIESEITSLF